LLFPNFVLFSKELFSKLGASFKSAQRTSANFAERSGGLDGSLAVAFPVGSQGPCSRAYTANLGYAVAGNDFLSALLPKENETTGSTICSHTPSEIVLCH
jgi:hypothetical protein